LLNLNQQAFPPIAISPMLDQSSFSLWERKSGAKETHISAKAKTLQKRPKLTSCKYRMLKDKFK